MCAADARAVGLLCLPLHTCIGQLAMCTMWLKQLSHFKEQDGLLTIKHESLVRSLSKVQSSHLACGMTHDKHA